MMQNSDIYQDRYLKHQARKKDSLMSNWGTEYKKYKISHRAKLLELIESRRSQRIFNRDPIVDDEINTILDAIDKVPSSCDRQGITYIVYNTRDAKDLLGGLLVGGVGWVQRADMIILLFADMQSYKNPAERSNMPFLDAGVVVQQTYLIAEALNIGCCFVNPNIRDGNKKFFNKKFNQSEHLFCGALALGKYDKKAYK